MRDDLEPSEFKSVLEERMDFLFDELLKKWIVYREYVTIEFDTSAGTARVCERT